MKRINYLFVFTLTSMLFLAFLSFGTANAQDKGKWVAPKSADQIKSPLQGDEATIKAGKKIYNQYCAVCHGNKGKGDGIAGMSLKPRPSNFTSASVQAQSDGALFWKISEGRSPMATYKQALSETQRWQLVKYIRTLGKK